MSFKLNKDEYVIYEARRNWVVLFSKTIAWIFSILIPILIFSVFQSTNLISFGPKEDTLLMVFVMSWFFVVWNFVFTTWTDHFLDILIITNKHLVDIEQKGLFAREISVINLENIQDVTTFIKRVFWDRDWLWRY